MLSAKDVITNLAVKDLAIARQFYEQTLGIPVTKTEGDELLELKSGNTTIFVYRSEFAGTNKATAMSWYVGKELEDIVQTLKSKGITFEHYNMPGLTLEGDVHVAGSMKVAWFKDPDGNILSLLDG